MGRWTGAKTKSAHILNVSGNVITLTNFEDMPTTRSSNAPMKPRAPLARAVPFVKPVVRKTQSLAPRKFTLTRYKAPTKRKRSDA